VPAGDLPFALSSDPISPVLSTRGAAATLELSHGCLGASAAGPKDPGDLPESWVPGVGTNSFTFPHFLPFPRRARRIRTRCGPHEIGDR
jgi:hypothetical protein